MSKKKTKKKAAPKKTKAKAKLKLGFDPLAIDDQEPIDEMEHAEVGIDALIRDTTSSEDIIATAAAEGSVDEPENEEEHEEDTTPTSGEPGIDLDMGMQEEPSSVDEQPVAEPEPTPEPEPVAPPEIVPEPVAQPEPETEPEPVAPSVEKSGEKGAADSFRGSADDGEGDSETFFSFTLAEESYAIHIELVKEVLEYVKPTKVPQTLEHMKGVINLRGSVIPVVCLRGLFGIPEVDHTVNTAIVIVEVNLEGEKTTIGVLIDAVREVMRIMKSDIEPPAQIGNMVKTGYISGMGKVNDDFVMILDVDVMLSMQELTGEE